MRTMICRELTFYEDFHCLGDRCPYTCCRDWEIVVDEDYLARCGEASEALREAVLEGTAVDGEGERCFRLTPRGYCVFLSGSGLCGIQHRWGEEKLSEHCASYPRFIEEYGCMTERNLAMSCPEAARLAMEQGAYPYCTSDDGVDDPPFEGVDGALLAGLVESRLRALRILPDKGYDGFWAYLRMLLAYAAALQKLIEEGRFDEMVHCQPPQIQKEFDREQVQARAVELLSFLSGLTPLRPQWPELLKRRAAELAALSPDDYAALVQDYNNRSRKESAENLWFLAQVLLFHHWPKAVNDGDLYGRVKFVAAACAALYHLGLLAWREEGMFSSFDECLLWAQFSREVEHDEENFWRLAAFE